METAIEEKAAVTNEEEKGEDAMTKKRIFVGGLGEKVTEGDLHNTFSSLGTVKAVQFVRTNGRSFAYIDFQPSSSKSLSKLFSSYNGCVWKGGRLRLEEAKEHYMVRLKREWEEDAELVHKTTTSKTEDEFVVADESKDLSKKSKLLNLEKKQLQIFFPKLRKVKAVPYSGTGKHKYSFQRIEVPRYPIHFCDCEEHSAFSEAAKVKHIPDFEQDQDGGIVDGEELNMMRSVMNKIFNKKDKSEQKNDDTPIENTIDNNIPPNEKDVDQENDIDNLVINIISGGNSNAHQGSEFGDHLYSNVRSTRTMIKAPRKEKNDTILKKPLDESTKNEFASSMPNKTGPTEETNLKVSKHPLIAIQPEKKGDSQQLPTDVTRRQKSSWKELIGGGGGESGTFSISHILPDASLKQLKTKKRVRFEDEENVQEPNDDEKPFNGVVSDTTTESKRWKSRKQEKRKPVISELAKEEAGKEKIETNDGDLVDSEGHMEEGGKVVVVNTSVGSEGHIEEAGKENASSSIDVPESESGLPSETENQKDCGKQPSWEQKSSWRELVGGMDNNSFSISHILPDPSSKRQKLASNSATLAAINPFNNLQHKATCSDMSSETERHSGKGKMDNGKKRSISPPVRKAPTDAEIGKVCSFMRNAETEKEWIKLRTAMSGSAKRKSNDKQ